MGFNPLSLLTGGLIKGVGKIIDDVSTSDEERGQIELEKRKLALAEKTLEDRADERQVEVNREEAKHPSLFVAGWRPAAGWTCVLGLLYHYLIYPITMPFVAMYTGVVMNDIDIQQLMVLLLGMLGIGGIRMWEKFKGVARDRVRT